MSENPSTPWLERPTISYVAKFTGDTSKASEDITLI